MGAANGSISSVFPVSSLGEPSFSWGFAWEATKVATLHAVGGAAIGATNGATMGYAGGGGNWETILAGTYRGDATGAIFGTALAGGEYFARDWYWALPTDIITKYTLKLLVELTARGAMPLTETSVLTVTTSIELNAQPINKLIEEKCNTEDGCIKDDVFGGRF